jgi:hypothetical protein
MRNSAQSNKVALIPLFGCVGFFIFAGCESLQDTSFAPLEAKLESIPNGGAQYFVVVNSSGEALHNLKFWVDIWYNQAMTSIGNDPDTIPTRLPEMTYSCRGSVPDLESGQEVRFRRNFGMGAEGSVLYPVSRVQIAGNCDEGHFREDWQINSSGQLRPLGVGSQ